MIPISPPRIDLTPFASRLQPASAYDALDVRSWDLPAASREIPDDEPDQFPGWEPPADAPDPADEAEFAGLMLGLEGEDAAPAADLRDDLAHRFLAGWAAGARERDEANAAWVADREAQAEAMYGSDAGPDYAELVEARGYDAVAKMEGGR